MNFLSIFSLILGLVKPVVLTIEAVHGTQVAGGTKADMAKTALTGALATAGLVLTGDNANLASLIGGLAGAVIDTTVALTKKTGEFQAATKASLNLPAPPAAA